MSTMRDALLKAGLLSPDRHQQLERVEAGHQSNQAHHAQQRVLKNRAATLVSLAGCQSVNEFRSLALHVLLEDETTIADVIRLAHGLKESDGGKRLIWQLYQIRDDLATLSRAEYPTYLRRALRKAGGLGSRKQRRE